jgi:hypothetical protein
MLIMEPATNSFGVSINNRQQHVINLQKLGVKNAIASFGWAFVWVTFPLYIYSPWMDGFLHSQLAELAICIESMLPFRVRLPLSID